MKSMFSYYHERQSPFWPLRHGMQRMLSNKQTTLHNNESYEHGTGTDISEEYFESLFGVPDDTHPLGREEGEYQSDDLNPQIEPESESIIYPEFYPDRLDMKTLAYAYLKNVISCHKHSFFSGMCEDSRFAEERFNRITQMLGEDTRREIIDELDRRNDRKDGEDWQLFKYSCREGFWSRPADQRVLLKIAETVSEEYSFETAGEGPGPQYVKMLLDLRETRKTGNLPPYWECKDSEAD